MTSSKVAIITGSGRGIGAATAKLFASNGYAVCVNYLSNALAADEVCKSIQEQGGKSISIQADVSTEAGVEKLFTQADQNLGTVSVLVNNAGVLKSQMRLEEMYADRINAILSNNVTSAILCCREAVKRMSTKHAGNGGSIINVSSLAAQTGSPNEYIDYAASKGAIDSLTRGLAKEVAAEGIRVNCVRPGLIYTEMHGDGGEPERVERLKHNIPMGRGGAAEEVAEAIYWLASVKASFSTGCFVDITGGL